MNKKTDNLLNIILGENLELQKNYSNSFGIYQENGEYFLCSEFDTNYESHLKNIIGRCDYLILRSNLYNFLASQGYDNNIVEEIIKSVNSGAKINLKIDRVIIGKKVLKNTKRAKILNRYKDKNSKWITNYEKELQIPKNENPVILKSIKNKIDGSYIFEIDVDSVKSERQILKYSQVKSKKKFKEKFNVNKNVGRIRG